jgi:outer membrane biogenesis lipoprotein LolB
VKRHLSPVTLCAMLLLSACTTASPQAQNAPQWQNCRAPAYCGPAINYSPHGQGN